MYIAALQVLFNAQNTSKQNSINVEFSMEWQLKTS